MDQLKTEIIKHKSSYKNKIQLIGDSNNSFNIEKNITICVYNSVSIIEPYIELFEKIFIDEAHHIKKSIQRKRLQEILSLSKILRFCFLWKRAEQYKK